MRILYRPVFEGVLSSLRDIFVEGWPADKVIGRHLKTNRKWGSHDRKLYAEAVYDLVRWWRRLLFASSITWPTDDRWSSGEFQNLSRAVIVWCLIHDVKVDDNLEIPVLDERSTLAKWRDSQFSRAVIQSIPNWLDGWGAEQLGEKWDDVLPILNTQAPVFLRTNSLKTNPEALVAALSADRVPARVVVNDAVQLAARANVFLSKSFAMGHFEVQDLHSQEVAKALMVEPGQRVIDACAGAGGKSLHLAALMRNKGKIISLDIAPKKLDQLRERATRAGATSIEVRPIESSKTIKRLSESADRLLLDVPCSGLGVLRRNPDTKWKLSLSEIAQLKATQAHLLNSYSKMCKHKGLMVYATCSIAPEENEKQVEAFISQNESQWTLEQQTTLWPQENGGDGFYWARLRRS